MAVSVRLPKLPTSTSPGAAAMVCGVGPTGMAAPGCMVATSIGVTVLLPESATKAVAVPEAVTATAMATGSVPTAIGVPARQVPRSTGVTLFASRFATSATPLPLAATGRHRHRVRLDPHADLVHDLVGGRVDLVQLVVALRDDEEVLAPGCVGQARRAGCPP